MKSIESASVHAYSHAAAEHVIPVLIVCAGWSCREGCALVQAPVRPSRQQQAGEPTCLHATLRLHLPALPVFLRSITLPVLAQYLVAFSERNFTVLGLGIHHSLHSWEIFWLASFCFGQTALH